MEPFCNWHITLSPSEILSQRNVWDIRFYHVGIRLELLLILEKWLQTAKVRDLPRKKIWNRKSQNKYWRPRLKENKKQNQYRDICVQDTQREWGCRRLKEDRQISWKSLCSNFEKHNHLKKKEGNVCSYWIHGDFQLNRAAQSDFSKSKGHQCVDTTGKNCQQFNHQAGSYTVRSMTNSVPAGLNSQLQCYPYSSDKALTADYSTREQELPIDNKAMLRSMAKCKVSIGDSQKARSKYWIKFNQLTCRTEQVWEAQAVDLITVKH